MRTSVFTEEIGLTIRKNKGKMIGQIKGACR